MTERKQRAQVGMWWCERAGIDLEGKRETAAAEVDTDGLEE